MWSVHWLSSCIRGNWSKLILFFIPNTSLQGGRQLSTTQDLCLIFAPRKRSRFYQMGAWQSVREVFMWCKSGPIFFYSFLEVSNFTIFYFIWFMNCTSLNTGLGWCESKMRKIVESNQIFYIFSQHWQWFQFEHPIYTGWIVQMTTCATNLTRKVTFMITLKG